MPASDSRDDARPRIFLSHASADAAIAQRVCASLEAADIRCWMAPRDVAPGEPYAAAIVEAINACDRVLLLLSRSAVASSHVLREVERAASKGRPILSLRLDEIALPAQLEYFLSATQWIDAPGGRTDDILPKLISALGAPVGLPAPSALAHAAAPSAAPDQPQPGQSHPGRPHRGRLVAAGVVILLAGVLAALLIPGSPWKRTLAGQTASPPATTPATTALSVAVLPLADLSEKKDQEYFSDGLTEELIDELGRIPELRVPARTSSFYFKGKQATTAQISKTLGVTHLLEGSVRKSGNALRISVELIRADTDSRVWSQSYDRSLADVFKVQEEIATAVAAALRLNLLENPGARAAPTDNTEAYTLYLTALAISRRGNRADALSAIADLERVVALDPGFADAWAALADVRLSAYTVFNLGALKDVREGVLTAADRAIAIAPDLAGAHVVRARVFLYLDWDLDRARDELQSTLRQMPNNTQALRLSAGMALVRGQYEDALARLRKAADQDPLSPWSYFYQSFAYEGLDRMPEAQAAIRRAIDVAPGSAQFHAVLATLLTYEGRNAEALDELKLEPDPMFRETRLPWLLYKMGRTAEGDQALAVAEGKYATEAPDFIATAYAARGDLGHAIEWADRAIALRCAGVFFYQADLAWRPFLHDPKFRAFWARTGLSREQ